MKKFLKIDLSVCFECGETKQDMHHVIPKSKGGTKMIPLCAKCHGLIHDRNFVKHRQLLKEGVERARLLGKYTGRKVGATISVEDTLKKHE
jgi:5-methylcytosine-specific restriction endonuclease McrA